MKLTTRITLAAVSAIAMTFGAAQSFAQQAAAAPAAPAPAGPPPAWYKTCAKQADNDICSVQNIQRASSGQVITAVALITVSGKNNQKILQVSVPAARLIAPGVSMQIDGGKAQKIDYYVCMPDACNASMPLTDGIVTALKKGHELVLTSVNYRQAPNPIKISLDGFGGAFDGEPMSESKLAETQRNLQDSMQKKAEEARKKLEDAQNAAKQQQ